MIVTFVLFYFKNCILRKISIINYARNYLRGTVAHGYTCTFAPNEENSVCSLGEENCALDYMPVNPKIAFYIIHCSFFTKYNF